MPITRHGYKPKGTTTQRGYGHQHRKLRATIAKLVNTGQATCHRCHQPIQPGTPWDLDHTTDRTAYHGPTHATCNRANK